MFKVDHLQAQGRSMKNLFRSHDYQRMTSFLCIEYRRYSFSVWWNIIFCPKQYPRFFQLGYDQQYTHPCRLIHLTSVQVKIPLYNGCRIALVQPRSLNTLGRFRVILERLLASSHQRSSLLSSLSVVLWFHCILSISPHSLYELVAVSERLRSEPPLFGELCCLRLVVVLTKKLGTGA